MKLVLFLIIIVLVVNTIVATIMGKKENLRAAKRAAKEKLSPKPKEQRARRRADQARKGRNLVMSGVSNGACDSTSELPGYISRCFSHSFQSWLSYMAANNRLL